MPNMPQRPRRLKRRMRPDSDHVEETGDNERSASPMIRRQLDNNGRIDDGPAGDTPSREIAGIHIPDTNRPAAQQKRVSDTPEGGLSAKQHAVVRDAAAVGSPGRVDEDTTVATSLDLDDPIDRTLTAHDERPPPASHQGGKSGSDVPTARLTKPSSFKVHSATRLVPRQKLAAQWNLINRCVDGFTGVQRRHDPKSSKELVTPLKQRVNARKKKPIKGMFKALTLANGPLPLPACYSEPRRQTTPAAQAPEHAIMRDLCTNKGDSTPHSPTVGARPRILNIDASIQTSPSLTEKHRAERGCLRPPGITNPSPLALNRPANANAEPAPSDDFEEQENLFSDATTEIEQQSDTQPDSYAERVYGPSRRLASLNMG